MKLKNLVLSLSCFGDKRYVLNDGIRTLAYFHKDSVTSCKEVQKDSDKENCDDWKGLWWLKKIVMIEKNYDGWKKLWLKKFMLVIRCL